MLHDGPGDACYEVNTVLLWKFDGETTGQITTENLAWTLGSDIPCAAS